MTSYRQPSGKRRRRRRTKDIEFRNRIVPNLPKAGTFMNKWIDAEIRRDARRGRAGSGKKLPALTPDYARRKAKAGGTGKPDFRLTGALLQSVGPFPTIRARDFVTVTVGAHGEPNQKKALMLALGGRVLFDLPRRDLRRMIKAMTKANVLITNEKGGERGARFVT